MVTKRAAELELVGGNLALDLANTLDGPRDGQPGEDYLRDVDDLVAWARHAGAPVPGGAEAARLLEPVRELRAAVHAAFHPIATGGAPPDAALQALLAAHAAGLARARLVPEGGRFALAAPDLPGAIAAAAVDLLRHGPLDRVKACPECRWLFVDASRNRSRRWCSMNECGGRLKMRRLRARRRATAGR